MKKVCVFVILVLCFGLISAEEKTVNLVTLEWEPYIGSKLKNGGYLAEIAREAFKAAGYETKITYMPWSRALEVAKRGDFDGVIGAYYSDERAEFFEYPDKIDEVKVVFFSKKGRNITFSKIEDLKPYKIGVIRGYVQTEEFDNADYLQKDESADSETVLKKLIHNRVDLIVDTKKTILHLANTKFPDQADQIEEVKPELKSHDLYIIFSKNAPDYMEKTEAYNKGLKIIKDSGRLKEIKAEYGF